MRKKRLALHLWHHWKSGSYRVVQVPGGVIVDYRVGEVNEPFVSTLRGAARTVFGEGYRWVYFTPRGENHSVIVAFDTAGIPLQLYVDICDGHGLEDDGHPFIQDMYLDVLTWITLLPGGTWLLDTPEIIDADELDAALAAGHITAQQHAAAWVEARRVEGLLLANRFPALEVVRAFVQDRYT